MSKKLYNHIKIYDNYNLHCIFDISCKDCVRQDYCSRSKKRRCNCELEKTIQNLKSLKITRDIVGVSHITHFIDTGTCDNMNNINIILWKLAETYQK